LLWPRYCLELATTVGGDGEGGGGAAPLYEDASEVRDGGAAVTRRYSGRASWVGDAA
jgi:hypothetical protein